MKTTLENKKKVVAKSPRSVFKRKNRVEERGASSSKVKREQESINLRAQKMMKGKMGPYATQIVVKATPIVVKAVPTVVQVARQTIEIPQMTIPQETQLMEQRYEVPQMTSP
jgi:hypothetical protein